MNKWIPFFVIAVIALVCTFATLIVSVWAYLAVTGLDLLVTASKTAPKVAVIFACVSFFLWVVDFIVFIVMKPYKHDE